MRDVKIDKTPAPQPVADVYAEKLKALYDRWVEAGRPKRA